MMQADVLAHEAGAGLAIGTRAQSKNIYDPVVYQKGAAILMMLDGWLGEDNVRDGCARIFANMLLRTRPRRDLARALDRQTGKDPCRCWNRFWIRREFPG